MIPSYRVLYTPITKWEEILRKKGDTEVSFNLNEIYYLNDSVTPRSFNFSFPGKCLLKGLSKLIMSRDFSRFPNVKWQFQERKNRNLFAYMFVNYDKFDYLVCSISHVKVVGRPLSPAFDVKIHHPSGKCTLKYCPQTDSHMCSTSSPGRDSSNPSRLRSLTSGLMQRGVRHWEQIILGALLGSGAAVVDD